MSTPDFDGAYSALLRLVEGGREFPDATANVLARFPGVSVDALKAAYDEEKPDTIYES